jgi:glucose/arabinose dehydrogenase
MRAPEKLYAANCASCHGTDGSGGQGPSLVDDVWNLGADDASLAGVIAVGAGAGTMPAYGEVLSQEQIRSLVVLVRELRESPRLSAAKQGAAGDGARYSSQLAEFALTEVFATDGILWGLDFLPGGQLILSERSGKIIVLDGQRETVLKGTPAVHSEGDIGLLDLELHPDYAKNGWIYVAAAVEGDPTSDERRAMTELIRGRVRDGHWVDEERIFQARVEHRTMGKSRLGSRILFHEGYLYFTIGDGGPGEPSQDLTMPTGKTFRMHDDGRIPADNPFAGQPGIYQAIWTYGNRNVQGLAVQPGTGILFASEHGPRGGDELYVLRPGANYGWPLVTYGIEYNGQPVSAAQ